MAVSKSKPKGRRCLRFLLFFLLLVGVVVGASYAGLALARAMGFGQAEQTPEAPRPGEVLFDIVLSLALGAFFLGAAGFVYLITLWTRGFTFNFQKPFLGSLKTKMFGIKIFFLLFLALGLGAPISVVTEPLLMLFGIPPPFSRTLPIMAILVLYSLSQAWFSVWTPLEKSTIQKRMAALGVPEGWIERGIPTGISDPAKSSYKKLTIVEEDVGLLWVMSKSIKYVGDSDRFTIRPGRLLEVQRVADPGSVSCLGGALPVLIEFQQDDGSERRVRLHAEGHWTTKGAAQALDRLEETLATWQNRAQAEFLPEENEAAGLEQPS